MAARSSGVSTSAVEEITRVLRTSRWRPKAQDGKPGGLVELPPAARPIIVGDLHSCHENLAEILGHDDNERSIKRGEAVLVLLGDTVHNDQTGRLREMASSLVTLEYVFELFGKYRNRIIYLRGNHDTFDENLVKSGIRQGLEFRAYVQQQRGTSYVAAVERFFEELPVFLTGEGFLITHAGPIRGGATREELINVYSNRDSYWQLLWNRINEFGGTPSVKEYDRYDIEKTRERLGVSPKTHFIVGHNPLWNTGNRTGVWLNVLGIPNHHILYSGAQTRAPYLTFDEGKLVVSYAIAERTEALYV